MFTEFIPFKYLYLPMAAAVAFLYGLSYVRSRRLTLALILLFGCVIAALTAFAFLSEDVMKVGLIVACAGLFTVLICIEPYIGLLLLVLFVYVRPQELDPSLKTLRLISITGSWAVLAWILSIIARRGEKSLFSTPVDGMILGVFLIMIASSIFNRTGMAGDVATDFLSNVFVHFVVIGSVITVRRFDGLIWLLVALGALLAGQGVVQYFTGVGLGGSTMIQGRIRAWGIFHDPNDLAQVLVLLLPFLVVYFMERRMVSRKLLSLGMIALSLYGIFLTNSRGGMLSVAAAAAVYCWRRYGKVLGIVLMVLVLGAILVLGPSRMSEMSSEESSASDRISAWRAGLWMMRVNPVLGIGPNMFGEWHGLVAHNSFVHGITEIGFIGIFLWLAMIYMAFRYLAFVRNQTKHVMNKIEYYPKGHLSNTTTSEFYTSLNSLNGFSVALEASLVSYLVAAFFLSRTYNVILFMLLAMCVALYLIASKVMDESLERQFAVYDVLMVGGIQVGLVMLVYVMVRFL